MSQKARGVLYGTCFGVSVGAFVVFLAERASGRIDSARWSIAIALIGMVVCMLFPPDERHD